MANKHKLSLLVGKIRLAKGKLKQYNKDYINCEAGSEESEVLNAVMKNLRHDIKIKEKDRAILLKAIEKEKAFIRMAIAYEEAIKG